MKTVLIVEDDPTALIVLKTVLEREYRVITTEIPEDALAVCSIEPSPEPFSAESWLRSAVSGLETLLRVYESRPQMPLLIVLGTLPEGWSNGDFEPLMISTAVLAPTPIVADKAVSIGCENEFVRLHKACRRDLETFYEGSQQLLNLLVLAELFPRDVAKQTALEYHFRIEVDAKHDYDRRRLELFDFMTVRSLEKKAASRKHRSSKP